MLPKSQDGETDEFITFGVYNFACVTTVSNSMIQIVL